MVYCPDCKSEYVDGTTICADCGTELVPQLAEEVHLSEEEFSEVYSAEQLFEVEMIKANLDGAGIESFILNQKDRNYPSSGDLTVIKLYVKSKDADDALSFIQNLNNANNEVEGEEKA